MPYYYVYKYKIDPTQLYITGILWLTKWMQLIRIQKLVSTSKRVIQYYYKSL